MVEISFPKGATMKKIKYDKFKQKLIRQLGADSDYYESVYRRFEKISPFDAMAISVQNGEDWKANLATMKDMVAKTIESWDIRMVNKLFEIFPKEIFPAIIPNKYKKIQPLLDYDEAGDWCIIFNIYS
jgi:hypothetical protein